MKLSQWGREHLAQHLRATATVLRLKFAADRRAADEALARLQALYGIGRHVPNTHDKERG